MTVYQGFFHSLILASFLHNLLRFGLNRKFKSDLNFLLFTIL